MLDFPHLYESLLGSFSSTYTYIILVPLLVLVALGAMLYYLGFAIDVPCNLVICNAKIGTEQFEIVPIAARFRKRLNHENEWGLNERRTEIFRLALAERWKV